MLEIAHIDPHLIFTMTLPHARPGHTYGLDQGALGSYIDWLLRGGPLRRSRGHHCPGHANSLDQGALKTLKVCARTTEGQSIAPAATATAQGMHTVWTKGPLKLDQYVPAPQKANPSHQQRPQQPRACKRSGPRAHEKVDKYAPAPRKVNPSRQQPRQPRACIRSGPQAP